MLRHKRSEYQLYTPAENSPPIVRVRRDPIPALLERIKREVKSRYGVGVYGLRWILPDDIPGVSIPSPTLVLFVRSEQLLNQNNWINQALVETLAQKGEIPRVEAELFRHALKAIPRQPWSHYCWFPDACKWFDQQLQDHGLANGRARVKQVSISSAACVLATNTAGGRFFFKATRDYYRYEVNLTAWLSQTFPDAVPSLVAADVANARFLCHSSGDRSLLDLEDFALWQLALDRLARLQRACVCHVSNIRNLGVPSHPLNRLADRFAALLRRAVNVLREGKQPIANVEPSLISCALANVARLCRELESFQLPETLVHCDLNPSNIVCGSGGPTFIDWTYCSITHPFLGLSFCLFCCQNPSHVLGKQYAALAEGYLDKWVKSGSVERLSKALQVASELAPYYDSLVALTLLLERLADTPGELASVGEVVKSIINRCDRSGAAGKVTDN